MIQLFRSPRFNFIGRRRLAYMLSAILMVLGLGTLAVRGLRYDIDFTGGVLVQVRFEQPPTVTAIRAGLTRIQLGESVIQRFGDDREYIVRLPLTSTSPEDLTKRVTGALAQEASLGTFEIRRIEFVGPQVGRDLQLQAIYAVLFGLAGILIYIAWAFKSLKGGVAAIVAVFHDIVICLGALSITGREFSLPVLAALLTIIGYSVNDTIVAYDRLRENRGKHSQRGRSFAEQMNDAINQTLSRTVLTALTTFLSAMILLMFGGKVLEDFAFVLVIGVVTGTYSTIYIAGAIIVDWTQTVEGRVARRKKAVAKA
jgi:preprotein translocase SecF subunit